MKQYFSHSILFLLMLGVVSDSAALFEKKPDVSEPKVTWWSKSSEKVAAWWSKSSEKVAAWWSKHSKKVIAGVATGLIAKYLWDHAEFEIEGSFYIKKQFSRVDNSLSDVARNFSI